MQQADQQQHPNEANAVPKPNRRRPHVMVPTTVPVPKPARARVPSRPRRQHAAAVPDGYAVIRTVANTAVDEYLAAIDPNPARARAALAQSSSRAVAAMLDLADKVDRDAQTAVFEAGGLPALAHTAYAWENDVISGRACIEKNGAERDHAVPTIARDLDLIALALPPRAALDAVMAVTVALVDYQKQAEAANRTLTRSLGHQLVLAALIAQHARIVLLEECRNHDHFFAWFQDVYPALWTDASSGLVLTWVLQRTLLAARHARASPSTLHLLNAIQARYVEFVGSSLMVATTSTEIHHAAVILMIQIVDTVTTTANATFTPDFLELLLAVKRSDISSKKLMMLLEDVTRLRQIVAQHLWQHPQLYLRSKNEIMAVLWLDDDRDTFLPIRGEAAAFIVGLLRHHNQTAVWWRAALFHVATHPLLTHEIVLRLAKAPTDLLAEWQKHIAQLDSTIQALSMKVRLWLDLRALYLYYRPSLTDTARFQKLPTDAVTALQAESHALAARVAVLPPVRSKRPVPRMNTPTSRPASQCRSTLVVVALTVILALLIVTIVFVPCRPDAPHALVRAALCAVQHRAAPLVELARDPVVGSPWRKQVQNAIDATVHAADVGVTATARGLASAYGIGEEWVRVGVRWWQGLLE
ncbi:hypothetical protein GGF32_003912 [Allomyces javanicus]|nr:hypothetical protein GGF32_003912 [Allomyces javanicus]